MRFLIFPAFEQNGSADWQRYVRGHIPGEVRGALC